MPSSAENTRSSDSRSVVYLARIYRFSSAHRLYSSRLTEEENRKVYGKCSNPKGHGHNYVLEVSVRGNPDPRTGAVVNVEKLDRIVSEKVLIPWDHKHLDQEVADFRGRMSTGENMAQIVWEKLENCIPSGKLSLIRLSETSRSFFEYSGEKS